MSSLKLEVSNEPEKKELLDEEEEPIENNNDNIEINYEYELQKCFPNLKECPELYEYIGDFYPKYDVKIESQHYNYLEWISIGSGYSIAFFIFFIFIAFANAFAFFTIYFILVGLQFFHPEFKKLFKATRPNKIDFEEFQKKINDITKANISFKTRYNNKNSYKFVVKNYIDVSGELDMTKPPKGINSEKKTINNNKKSLKNKVIIMTCPTRLYTIDKETKKKIEIYDKEFGVFRKMPKNLTYIGKFYREFNYFSLISILFLSSSIFYECLGADIYYIEPRKIISCEEDLNNNFYASLCINFRPKYIFYTGEQIIFNDNCIIKAEDEKVKEFNDNYDKMIKKINQRLEEENKKEEEFKKLGIYRGLVLYHKALGNLKIKASIKGYETIEIDLVYCLDGQVEITYLNYPNRLIITDKIYFDCLKEGLVKEGNLTYLYIKYLKEPIIIGNYYALSYTFSYRGEEHTFAYFA